MSSPAKSQRRGKRTRSQISPERDPPSRDAVNSSPSRSRQPDDADPMSVRSDLPLFSSPAQQPDSEIDLSSPLNYGTPSSRVGGSVPRTPGIAGTPLRRRPDLAVDASRRTFNMEQSSELHASEPSGDAAAEQMVIWGTDVVVSQCRRGFGNFLRNYIVPHAEIDEKWEGLDPAKPLYMQKLEEINIAGDPFLNFNCAHLKDWDSELYRQLVAYPQEVIPAFDMAANELFFNKFPDTTLEHQIQVRPYNADRTKNMRSLNPEDIDQLLTVQGMVIRTSSLIPEMREGFFQCHVCHNTAAVQLERGKVEEPSLCTHCQTKHSYYLVHNRSRFSDKQLVKLQEAPEDMPAGQTPHTLSVFAHGDLVDAVQPGDRVTITGIYRAVPVRSNPRQRNVKAVYQTYLDVVHYRRLDSRRLYEDSDDKDKRCTLSAERISLVKEYAQKKDIYERLAAALAPSIYEYMDVKKGILLQMFGGTKKDFSNQGRGNFRSDINILLCGDPGTSKSQLLQYVYNLVPRSQYTSGKGSSAVGLTAYVTKDPDTKQLVLQTGALVLSDNGVCCIDEFDKMSESTRSVLHEVMEQQTLSIAKAGIICQLNARTSVLAAANPVESQWNKNKTIIENIQLPHTLLSRFDLIFLLVDPQDELFDRRLASHLVSLYYQGADQQRQQFVEMDMLRDYIAYARACVHPKLSELASRALIEAYVDMRKVGSGRGQVSAYPRQLESLIRLAEAHAKMRLSDMVEVKDVEEARRLHSEALKQAAVDPSTGKIDISILTTGISGAARKLRADRARILKELIKAKGKVVTLTYSKLWEEYREKLIEKDIEKYPMKDGFDEALQDLQDDGEIWRTGTHVRVCS